MFPQQSIAFAREGLQAEVEVLLQAAAVDDGEGSAIQNFVGTVAQTQAAVSAEDQQNTTQKQQALEASGNAEQNSEDSESASITDAIDTPQDQPDEEAQESHPGSLFFDALGALFGLGEKQNESVDTHFYDCQQQTDEAYDIAKNFADTTGAPINPNSDAANPLNNLLNNTDESNSNSNTSSEGDTYYPPNDTKN